MNPKYIDKNAWIQYVSLPHFLMSLHSEVSEVSPFFLLFECACESACCKDIKHYSFSGRKCFFLGALDFKNILLKHCIMFFICFLCNGL